MEKYQLKNVVSFFQNSLICLNYMHNLKKIHIHMHIDTHIYTHIRKPAFSFNTVDGGSEGIITNSKDLSSPHAKTHQEGSHPQAKKRTFISCSEL